MKSKFNEKYVKKEEVKALVDKFGGKIFSIMFRKQNDELRRITGTKRKTEHEHLIGVHEMNVGYKTVTIANIATIKCNGELYVVI